MALRQKLKGDQNNPNINKTYDVLINFNKGIDKKSADDLANDNSFRRLTNFWNEKEGILTKRPGLYDTYFTDIIDIICREEELFGTPVNVNDIDKLTDFNNTVLKGQPLYFDWDKYYSRRLMPCSIIGMQTLKDDKFHDLLEHYNPNGENSFGSNGIPQTFQYNAIFVCSCRNQYLFPPHDEFDEGGFEDNYPNTKGLIITVLVISKNSINESINVGIHQVSTADNYYREHNSFYPSDEYFRWSFNLPLDDPLDIVSYNDYSYIPTGSDYIIRIKNNASYGDYEFENVPVPDGYDIIESNQENKVIVPIGKLTKENLYKPTPVEVNNIGFNILADNPLEFYDLGESQTDAIKGVFFSYSQNSVSEPISKIPPNAPFNIHILATGSTATSQPQYRPNNGDTDTTTNPYKNVPGSWSGQDNKLWACTGIDYDGEIELKITKGTSNFISYVSTGSNYNQEIGYVSNIQDLIYSSSHIKVINNQLVLYGGHGYIFFSEYDNFQYFPNYFYLFAATDSEEKEVTAIKYFRQYYAVFTNKRIKRMTGSFGADNFGLYPLSDFVGCPNGNTIKQVNNNLFFLNIDGLYRLKQGYVGEGTENVEKIDDVLGNEINSNNVLQSFVLNDYYIMVRKDKNTLMIYDYTKDNFFEFNLDATQSPVALTPNAHINRSIGSYYFDDDNDNVYNNNYPLNFNDFKEEYRPFKVCFQPEIFDEYGSCIYIPEYEYEYEHTTKPWNVYTYHELIINRAAVHFRKLRMSDLNFIERERRHKDAIGYISAIETPKLNMGSPTNTKKFKELYIKMTNENLEAIPLYLSIYIDDIAYITPENYYVQYDSDTKTYYYVYRDTSNITLEEGNKILNAQEVLGTLTLGEDVLGTQTIMQLKIKINKKGRSIKIALEDGFDDTSDIDYVADTSNTLCSYNRLRNTQNFSIIAMGIVYKLKKVKEG